MGHQQYLKNIKNTKTVQRTVVDLRVPAVLIFYAGQSFFLSFRSSCRVTDLSEMSYFTLTLRCRWTNHASGFAANRWEKERLPMNPIADGSDLQRSTSADCLAK